MKCCPWGATGWIAAAPPGRSRNNRLCQAKTKEGRWTIGVFDQGEDED